jgi:hypothetical protein
MSLVSITKVETVHGNDITELFNPYTDIITLRLVFDLAPGLIQMKGKVATIVWQVIEFRTNTVAYNSASENVQLAPNGPIQWLPIGTAHDNGLQWVYGDIFGFRGAVEFFTEQGAAIPNTLAVSTITWFRLEHISTQ